MSLKAPRNQTAVAEANRLVATQAAGNFFEDIRKRYPLVDSLDQLSKSPPTKSVLDKDEAYISFALTDSALIAFVVRSNMPVVAVKTPVQRRSFAESIDSFRSLLANSRIISSFVCPAQEQADPPSGFVVQNNPALIASRLGKTLLGPVAGYLFGVKRLFVSMDGELSQLPLEAVCFEGKFAVERFSIGYIQSLALADGLRRRRQSRGFETSGFLGVGGASYSKNEIKATNDSSRSSAYPVSLSQGLPLMTARAQRHPASTFMNWDSLPGTEKEVRQVAKSFSASSAEVLIGDEASESSIRRMAASGRLERFRYLLFATHGFVDASEPSLNAIVLSQVDSDPASDGYLTAGEILSLNLSADLTVLSACDTAAGKYAGGDGVLGLPYALTIAGSRSTVMTQWSIADEATAIFVPRLFDKVTSGQLSIDALAEVKREFLRSGQYASPFFWAPFVLYGLN